MRHPWFNAQPPAAFRRTMQSIRGRCLITHAAYIHRLHDGNSNDNIRLGSSGKYLSGDRHLDLSAIRSSCSTHFLHYCAISRRDRWYLELMGDVTAVAYSSRDSTRRPLRDHQDTHSWPQDPSSHENNDASRTELPCNLSLRHKSSKFRTN